MRVIALCMDGDPPSGLQGNDLRCCPNGKSNVCLSFLPKILTFLKPRVLHPLLCRQKESTASIMLHAQCQHVLAGAFV